MTVLRADRRSSRAAATVRRGAGIVILSAFVAAGGGPSAVAQTGAPLRLAPPEQPAPVDNPSVTPLQRPAEPSDGGVTVIDGISVQRLGTVDAGSVGTLPAGPNAIPEAVWKGSSRAFITDLLQRVPGTIASPPLRHLVRRLLLTAAPVPAPAGDGDAGALLAARAGLLVAMGENADADALIAAAGRNAFNAELAWPAFEARLLAGDTAGACEIVRGSASGLTSIDWQKALIFCQLTAEQSEDALFGLSLLHERKADGDKLFFAIADALALGQKPKIGKTVEADSVTPQNLAMLRLATVEVPKTFLDAAPANVAAAIARTPGLPAGHRLAAAMRAEAAGSMPAAEVRAIVEQTPVTEQELAAALTIAGTEAPAQAIALLYLAARAQDVPAARAEVLQRLWEVADEQDMTGTAARIAAPLLADIPPLAEFSWFAGTAIRIALYAGDRQRALGWYDAVAASAAADPVADAAATDLWPLLRLALGDQPRPPAPPPIAAAAPATGGAAMVFSRAYKGGAALPWDDRRLVRWLDADATQNPEAAPLRAQRLLALLAALGDPVPETAWRSALPPAAGVPAADAAQSAPAYRVGLDRAGRAGHTGEAILFAAAALAGRNAGAAGIDTVYGAAGMLTRARFTEAARAFALDAALEAGF